MKIKIIQVGEMQSDILKILIEDLNKRFKNKFVFYKKIPLPVESYNKYRNQYDSEIIFKHIANENNEKIIIFTSNDIFDKDLNFVFGLVKNNMALISTARLDPEFYNENKNFELLLNRTKKETIHELGHMFGLDHCNDPLCVMSSSDSISYIDEKKCEFCKNCSLKMSMEGIEI